MHLEVAAILQVQTLGGRWNAWLRGSLIKKIGMIGGAKPLRVTSIST
jgi:hypothetical protein